MTTNYLSKEGYDKIAEDLKEAKTAKRKEIAERIEEAKKFGDLSENAEYHEAREAQERNERRIAELEVIIKTAKIITKSKKTDRVEVGSTGKAKSEGRIIEFTIVGSEEAEPLAWRISNESPMGKSFLGKKIGEEVDVITPKGKIKYKILEIN